MDFSSAIAAGGTGATAAATTNIGAAMGILIPIAIVTLLAKLSLRFLHRG